MTPTAPAPTPPTARERRLSTVSQAFVALTLVAWVVSVLPYPWRHGTFVAGTAATGLGIWALILTFGAARSLFLRLLLAIGVAFAGALAFQGLVSSVFVAETQAYETCMSRAITLQAEAQCRDDLNSQIVERLGVPLP